MSWTRNSLVAAALLAGAGATADAATLVVRSSGPSARTYPTGASLADGTTIRLQPGDQLTLLDARGSRVLRGPGAFPAGGAAASPATATRFAALVGGGADRRVRIGAVRGLGDAPRRPNLWYVDPGQSGRVCVVDPASVTLWRPRPDLDQQVTIAGPKGATATFAWPTGGNTVAWPAAVPVTPGQDYRVAIGGAPAAMVTFAVLGTRPATLTDAASALMAAGCSGQLDLVVDSFRAPADAAG